MTQRAVDLFDQVAPVFDEVLPFFSGFGTLQIDWLAPTPGTRMLDLGAGIGALTAAALARGCRVTAIDVAPAMVARLSERHPEVQAQVMDAHHLDFPDDSFDLVCAGFVIHLLDDPAAAAAEVRRVLVPGGTFSFSCPTGTEGDRWDFYGDLLQEFQAHIPAGGGRLGRPLDGSELLTAAGFTGVTEYDIDQFLPVADADTFWRFALSHGSKAFIDSLPDQPRAQFEARLRAELATMDPIVYEAGATFYRGTSGP